MNICIYSLFVLTFITFWSELAERYGKTGKGVQRIYIVEYIYWCITCLYLLVHTCKNVDIYCVVVVAMVEAIAT